MDVRTRALFFLTPQSRQSWLGYQVHAKLLVWMSARALFFSFLSKFSLLRRELLHAEVLCRCPYALIFFRNLLVSRELLHAYVLCGYPHSRSVFFQLSNSSVVKYFTPKCCVDILTLSFSFYSRQPWVLFFLICNVQNQMLLALSPWYNRNGWLGVKHRVTYMLLALSLLRFDSQVDITNCSKTTTKNSTWLKFALHNWKR